MKLSGKAFTFGDHVNTDEIIPARYLYTSDPDELAQHLMEDVRSEFGKREDLSGNIITAGENFGCGSSREHAPIAIQAAGIVCVIAKSFARIFLRNSINVGLPIVELEAAADINENDRLEVNLQTGKVINHTQMKEYTFKAYPSDLQDIFLAGGWLEYIMSQEPSLQEYFQEIAQFPYRRENMRF